MTVLTDTQTTGDEFVLDGGPAVAILDGHSGGTWTLQVKGPSDDWVDTDVEWTANGIFAFMAAPGATYRVTGGTAGATVECRGVY